MFSWFSLQSGIRGGGYLSQIDALRGWAILLVFFFHAWGISGGSTGSEPFALVFLCCCGKDRCNAFFCDQWLFAEHSLVTCHAIARCCYAELKELLRGSGFTDCALVLPRRVYGLRCVGFLGHGI